MSEIEYPSELKVLAMRRLLGGGESVEAICEDLRIPVEVLLEWRGEVVAGLGDCFDRGLKKEVRAGERRVVALEKELKRKESVIDELRASYEILKNSEGL